jgi:hypothetical protein
MQVEPLSVPQQITEVDVPAVSGSSTESVQRVMSGGEAIEESEVQEMILATG